MRMLLLLLMLTVACTSTGDTQTVGENGKVYEPELYVGGITIPWGMDWLPNGDMLVTERSGSLFVVRNGEIVGEPVAGLPDDIYARGQGGLLDVRVHPDYENNGWIYFTYSSSSGEGDGANTALIRAKLENNSLNSIQTLYKATPNSTRGQHYGSRIEFDPDGYVYFSIGDRGNRDVNPQDLSRDAGKIYRLYDDGSVPQDNPFVGDDNALDAIWSYGHRNPQGMDVHPTTGKIWTHEHGPQGGDELNRADAGKNYGWPVISYGINYNGTSFTDITAKEGMEQPATYWDPSIAPSGMAFVTSDRYPDWNGHLLVGSLKFNYVELVKMDGDEVIGTEKVLEGIGRVRSLEEGPDGYIYVGVDGEGIYRINARPAE